jgi:hypothetical protein
MTIGGCGREKGIAAACPARFRKTTKNGGVSLAVFVS